MINQTLYYWVIGFILPWILGIYLFKKNPQILLIITPFACLVSYIINIFGNFYHFWSTSLSKNQAFSTLPMNIGLYGILGSYLIYAINLKKIKNYYILLVFSGITTLMEATWVYLDFIKYGNQWNLGLTFISYLMAYLMVYLYYCLLKKHHIFHQHINNIVNE